MMLDSSLHTKFIPCTASVAILIAFFQIVYAGYFSDDMINSTLKGLLIYKEITLPDFIIDMIKYWVIENGRFYPLGIVATYVTWFFADTLFKYKVIQITLIISNVILFIILVRNLSRNSSIAWIAVFMLSIVFQFNPRWSSLTSFVPLCQLTLIFILVSWLYAINAYTSIHPVNSIATALFTSVLAILTYEVGFVVYIGLLIIGWSLKKHDLNISRNLVFGAMGSAVAYICLYIYFSFYRLKIYDGVEIGSISLIAPTFFSQFFSAFPLAFLNNAIFPLDILGHKTIFVTTLLIFLILSFLLFYWTAQSNTIPYSKPILRSYILPWALASLLLVFPALLISISGKYQKYVTLGDPYIVSYFQFFGAAWLLSLIITYYSDKFKNRWRLILGLSLSVIAAGTVSINFERITTMNNKFYYPRVIMENALKNGLLDGIPAHARLIVDSPHPWENETLVDWCSSFFSQHITRSIECIGLDKLGEPGYKWTSDSAPLYFLRREQDRTRDGGEYLELSGGGEQLVFAINNNEIDKISRKALDGNSTLVLLGKSFHSWEPSGRREWAWSKGTGNLIFLNIAETESIVELTMSINSPVEQTVSIFFTGRLIFELSFQAGGLRKVSTQLALPAGVSFLEFKVSQPPVIISPDPRLFSFRIADLTIKNNK